MNIQYVYNEKGKKTGVLIPTELWNEIRDKIETENGIKKKVFNPSEYRGIYKNLKVDFKKEARSLREEWIRLI